jgi:poly-D-alanine transfer protein DltD
VQRARDLAMAQETVVDSPQYDKFELLVDKLSDIIVDYMKQPRNGDVIDGDSEPETEDDYPQLYKS